MVAALAEPGPSEQSVVKTFRALPGIIPRASHSRSFAPMSDIASLGTRAKPRSIFYRRPQRCFPLSLSLSPPLSFRVFSCVSWAKFSLCAFHVFRGPRNPSSGFRVSGFAWKIRKPPRRNRRGYTSRFAPLRVPSRLTSSSCFRVFEPGVLWFNNFSLRGNSAAPSICGRSFMQKAGAR